MAAAAPSLGCPSSGVGSASFPVGCWFAGANGADYSCGGAPFYGSMGGQGVTGVVRIAGA